MLPLVLLLVPVLAGASSSLWGQRDMGGAHLGVSLGSGTILALCPAFNGCEPGLGQVQECVASGL